MNRDRIEFYISGPNGRSIYIDSSFVPAVGQFISIESVTYTITSVTFAMDYAHDFSRRSMRCNVDLVEGQRKMKVKK